MFSLAYRPLQAYTRPLTMENPQWISGWMRIIAQWQSTHLSSPDSLAVTRVALPFANCGQLASSDYTQNRVGRVANISD